MPGDGAGGRRGPDHQAEHEQRADDRDRGGRGEGDQCQEQRVEPRGPAAAGLGQAGGGAGEHERTVEHCDGGQARGGRQRGRHDLLIADAQDLAEQ
ncbi:MAG TPA: hypothetical protein VGX23_00870 [Actinocrinis sp.]|nr:hypothetical protein [Actinocrinis sp.]